MGKADEANFRPTTCVDYLRQGNSGDLSNGIYKLYNKTGESYPAYCDLKSEPGTAWTLVMSWSFSNRRLSPFERTPLKRNSPVNENAQNWNFYRLSFARMRSLQAHSTHWRITCSYPTHGIDFRDYLRGNFENFNILDYVGSNGACKKVEFINIRGHTGIYLTVPFWQYDGQGLHTDSSRTNCQFTAAKAGAVTEEDNFGFYGAYNSNFRCTQGDQSTTQYWFGAHL